MSGAGAVDGAQGARSIGPAPGHEHTLYREGDWSLSHLRILDLPPTTPGMVRVGRDGEDYASRPELIFMVWPDLLGTDAGRG